jgi:tripartite-type tricarboxylate transporter receptor subunit TctC
LQQVVQELQIGGTSCPAQIAQARIRCRMVLRTRIALRSLEMQKIVGLAAFALFMSGILLPQAAADSFYRGKTVRIVVGAQAGASYDIYSRLISRHIGRHIPGEPTVVVQNINAAGGLVAANHLYNVAEKDGTVIGTFQRNSVLDSVIDNPKARFKIQNFNWLGTPASMDDNAYLFIIRHALPYKTIADLRTANPPLHVGVVNSPIHILKVALGLNVKIIVGYGKNALDLAFERGEVDGNGITYANLLSRKPTWLAKSLARPMIQFGSSNRLPALPNVPTAQELARNPGELALVKLTEAPLQIAYPIGMPPGVPADRVAIMRKAFMDTMNDPAFRNEAKKMKLDYSPRDGRAVEAAIAEIANSPKSAIISYREIFGLKAGG